MPTAVQSNGKTELDIEQAMRVYAPVPNRPTGDDLNRSVYICTFNDWD
jgi:hypothetical protein